MFLNDIFNNFRARKQNAQQTTNNIDVIRKSINEAMNDFNDYSLASSETIFAAILKLSNSVSSLPIYLTQGLERANKHPLDYLLSTAPNPNMTSVIFFQTMETLRNTFGNAYAMKKYDKYAQVSSLQILNPSLVEPVIESGTNELYYRITSNNGNYYVHNSEIIHLKYISTGVSGISPLDVLRGTVEYDRKIRSFSLDQMTNSIKASFVLKLTASLSKEKKKERKDMFDAFYKNNGGVIILDANEILEPIRNDMIDPKLFEIERITRERVALVFGLPLYKLNEGKELDSEYQSIRFLQDCLLPILRQYEQEFNRKLLLPQEIMNGIGFKFDTHELLRVDTKTRTEYYFRLIRSGVLMPNEARKREGLMPAANGDALLISKDLWSLGSEEEMPRTLKGGEDAENVTIGK